MGEENKGDAEMKFQLKTVGEAHKVLRAAEYIGGIVEARGSWKKVWLAELSRKSKPGTVNVRGALRRLVWFAKQLEDAECVVGTDAVDVPGEGG